MKPGTVTVKKLDPGEMVLTVRFSRPLLLRVWLATQIARLAAWVAGVGFEVKEVDPMTGEALARLWLQVAGHHKRLAGSRPDPHDWVSGAFDGQAMAYAKCARELRAMMRDAKKWQEDNA
jgi:hypothetical protein